MITKVSINQVLLFREVSASVELGEALWSALKEVEAFYNRDDGLQLRCRRFYFAAEKPPSIKSELGSDSIVADLENVMWQKAQGRYSHTYDQNMLGELVRDLLPPEVKEDRLLLVLDQEIIPPKEWRYVIKSSIRKGFAVSLRPIDPAYWRMEDRDRLATVKHRMRTACLSAVGTFLGLSRCSNAQCFLYRNVDSALRYDVMMFLGPEHNRPELKKRGFLRWPRRPAAMQRIVDADRLDTW